jgi:hypothetical protein
MHLESDFVVIARSEATKQSRAKERLLAVLDCFAEPVIRRRCADRVARNDASRSPGVLDELRLI